MTARRRLRSISEKWKPLHSCERGGDSAGVGYHRRYALGHGQANMTSNQYLHDGIEQLPGAGLCQSEGLLGPVSTPMSRRALGLQAPWGLRGWGSVTGATTPMGPEQDAPSWRWTGDRSVGIFAYTRIAEH